MLPGRLIIRLRPRMPAALRDRHPLGVMRMDSARIASGMPGVSRSTTSMVASGVMSRGEKPVPPVVSTRAMPRSSAHLQSSPLMLVPYNPAAKASPPKVPKHEADYFQPEEIADIVKALEKAPVKWKAMSYILIDTGCRRGELMGLQWNCVDLDKGIMMIRQALLYTKEKGTYIGPPKTGQPRAICLSPETIGVLKEYRTEQLRAKIRHADIWQDTGFLFTKDDGTPMHPDSITDWLNKFSEENDLPHIHPHAFRHTAASMMIANGVDLVNAAAELGHATASTTLNIYAHQVARARAEASGIRAGAFAVLRQA